MEVYDDNKDGKIDIREMAQLLPMEENFLLLFRFDNPLDSSVEFMKVRISTVHVDIQFTVQLVVGIHFHLMLIYFQLWYQYDTDGSGFIEADELKVSS